MTSAAYDPGTRSPALAISEASPSLPLPLLELATLTLPDALTPAVEQAHVAELLALLLAHGVSDLAIETQRLYVPKGASPGQMQKIAENYASMQRTIALLQKACADVGIVTHPIARGSWVSRVARKSNATNAEARAAVPNLLDPAGPLPTNQNEHDAAGILLGHLHPHGVGVEPPKPKVRRKPGDPKPKRNRLTEAWYARKNARSREATQKRREVAGVPEGRYVCKRCLGPRAGHMRGLPCPPRATTPLAFRLAARRRLSSSPIP